MTNKNTTKSTLRHFIATLRTGDNWRYAAEIENNQYTYTYSLVLGDDTIFVNEEHRSSNGTSEALYYGWEKEVKIGYPDTNELADWLDEHFDEITTIMAGAGKTHDGSRWQADWNEKAVTAWVDLFGEYSDKDAFAGMNQLQYAAEDYISDTLDEYASEIVAGTTTVELALADMDGDSWDGDGWVTMIRAEDFEDALVGRVERLRENA